MAYLEHRYNSMINLSDTAWRDSYTTGFIQLEENRIKQQHYRSLKCSVEKENRPAYKDQQLNVNIKIIERPCVGKRKKHSKAIIDDKVSIRKKHNKI